MMLFSELSAGNIKQTIWNALGAGSTQLDLESKFGKAGEALLRAWCDRCERSCSGIFAEEG